MMAEGLEGEEGRKEGGPGGKGRGKNKVRVS